ncbi:conjugation system SOS inhibitor PsiB family protein, partial [Escherichia coli]
IVVCSPGEASATWMVILVSISGRPFRVIRTQPSFSPETVNHILRLAASLDEAGYSTSSIINLLVTEGGAA